MVVRLQVLTIRKQPPGAVPRVNVSERLPAAAGGSHLAEHTRKTQPVSSTDLNHRLQHAVHGIWKWGMSGGWG